MNILMKNLYESALKDKQSLNIIVFPYDGLFEYTLAEAFPQHNFIIHAPSCIFKDWIKVSTLPNMSVVDNIPFDNHAHFIIINDKSQQWGAAINISHAYHIPLIYIEHLPYKSMGGRIEDIHILNIQKKVPTTIYTSQQIANDWNDDGKVIPYGLKFENYVKTDSVITNVNIQQLSQEVKNNIKLPLHNLNNNVPFEEQIRTHKYFLYFVNEPYDRLPIYVAMSKNCNVISNVAGQNIQTINPASLNNITLNAINNNQQYIEESFNIDAFTKNWEEIFNTVGALVYTR